MAVHEKSVIVDVPVHKVFNMWSNWEDFPKFMSHVKEVRMIDENKSHWRGEVSGIDEEWDAKTTKMIEDKVIGWESISGFDNKGEVRFDRVDGRTRITVHFEYNPPASVIGDVAEAVYVGQAFDKDLEEDLKKFKSKAESA